MPCVSALQHYIREANATCSLLNSITAFPVSDRIRQTILDQRLRENDAHERYRKVRDAFFAAAKFG
jgi:hypothetical protein